MNLTYFEKPEEYVLGTVFDEVPYSKEFLTHHNNYADPETPGFADAIFPSSWESFMNGLKPSHDQFMDGTYGTACVGEKYDILDGGVVSMFANTNWQIPFICVVTYVFLIFALTKCMKDRKALKLRGIKTIWNFGVSAFSFWGFGVLFPHLLFNEYSGLLTAGLEASICTHPSSFGCGWEGTATAAFCFSKCFELVDTILLVLAKKNLIFLHWYHHITVLLFCWLAYALRSSSGIYFALVNYFIHGVMYFYYGMTQYSNYTKSLVRPYAMQITFLQLSQMGFGLIIIGLTVFYKYHRKPCYTHANVNFFGILMYSSYFVLFLEIFVKRYFLNPTKQEADRQKKRA